MTTAGTIIDDALDQFLTFDKGRSDIGNDDLELFLQLNKILNRWYTAAAAPAQDSDLERNDYLAVSGDKTLAGDPPTIAVSIYAWVPLVLNASGAVVAVVAFSELKLGRADLPPAVYFRGLNMTSGGRTGDPIATDVLTLHYTPIPGPLTLRGHFIGATTPATEATSTWPAHLGDPALVLALSIYLAMKSQDFPPEELAKLQERGGQAFAEFLSYCRSVQ